MADTKRTKNTILTTFLQSGQASGSFIRQRFRDIIESVAHSRIVTEKGFMDYNDAETTGSPIALNAGVVTKLTNDGAGSNTLSTFKPDTVTDLWDVVGDQLNFSDLKLGDCVLLRIDVTVTTLSVNTDLDMTIVLDVGGIDAILHVDRESFKSSGTYEFVVSFPIYMGQENIRANPAEIKMEADKNSTVVVNGWAIFVQ